MKSDEFRSHHVKSASMLVWDLTDPTDLHEQSELLDQDLISLSKRPFSAKRVLVSLDNIKLVFHKTSRRVRTRTKTDANLVAFMVIGQNALGTIDGIELRPDVLNIVAPDSTADLVAEPGYESMSLMISPDHLANSIGGHGKGVQFQVPEKFYFKNN